MNAKIFNAISDSDFRIKAFSDYCDDTQNAYQSLLQAETMALESIPDDPEDDTLIDYDARADEILSSVGISTNNMLLFNGGYVSSHDFIAGLLRGFKETIVDEDGLLSDKTVQLRNAAGEVVGSSDLDQLTLEVKENLYSLTALCAANAAASVDATADRIAVFNDRLTTVFQNAYSTVSSTASYLRALISDNDFKSSEYLAQIDALMGISRLAADNSEELPIDMDITKYTGANPACALNFNGVFNTIGTVFNVGLKVVGNILDAGAKLAGKVFSKISGFFHKTVVDPFDIEEVDANSKSYTVDGWRYHGNAGGPDSPEGMRYTLTNQIFQDYIAVMNVDGFQDYIGKWVKCETIFGEFMFKLAQVEAIGEQEHLYFYPDVQFKPKAVNPDAVYLSAVSVWGEDSTDQTMRCVASNSQRTPTTEEILLFIESLRNRPDLYLSTDADEKKLCLAFACGTWMDAYFGQCAFTEMFNSIDSDSEPVSYPPFDMKNVDDWIAVNLTRRVTNLDFVGVSSGWFDGRYLMQPACPITEGINTHYSPFPDNDSVDLGMFRFLAWVLNRADRERHPVDYTFVPYRNNVDAWSPARFRIKTDQENQQAFDTLLTTIVVVVGTAVLSAAATIIVKKAVRSLYLRRTAAVGRLDAAMWSGRALTSTEKRQYIRLQRKLNGSKALSSGLQDSVDLFSSISSSISTVSEDASGVAQIVSLIK